MSPSTGHVEGQVCDVLLTGEPLRGARAMLKIEQGELANLSGVSVDTIKRLERVNGPLSANARTVDSLQRALEGEGALFMPENGGLQASGCGAIRPPGYEPARCEAWARPCHVCGSGHSQ